MADPAAAAGMALEQPAVMAALVTVSGALITATATYIITQVQARRQQRSHRKRAIIALFTEILTNLRDLEQTLGATDFAALQSMMQERAIPLHIVYTRNMRFFDSNKVEDLDLAPELLHLIVKFYTLLESIYAQLDAIRGRNFARISGPGRCRALAGLAEDVHRARSCGHRTIHRMETELPYAWLHPRGRRLSEAMAGEAWDRAA